MRRRAPGHLSPNCARVRAPNFDARRTWQMLMVFAPLHSLLLVLVCAVGLLPGPAGRNLDPLPNEGPLQSRTMGLLRRPEMGIRQRAPLGGVRCAISDAASRRAPRNPATPRKAVHWVLRRRPPPQRAHLAILISGVLLVRPSARAPPSLRPPIAPPGPNPSSSRAACGRCRGS